MKKRKNEQGFLKKGRKELCRQKHGEERKEGRKKEEEEEEEEER